MEKIKRIIYLVSKRFPKIYYFFKGLIPEFVIKKIKNLLTKERVRVFKNQTAEHLIAGEGDSTFFNIEKVNSNTRYKVLSVDDKNQGNLFSLVFLMEMAPFLSAISWKGQEVVRNDKSVKQEIFLDDPFLNFNKTKKSKKRVLIALPSYWRGGTEIATLELVTGLIKDGLDVWVFATSAEVDEAIYDKFVATGAKILYLPVAGIKNFPFQKAFIELVKYLAPDVTLIANSPQAYYSLPDLKFQGKFIDILHSEAPLGGSVEFEEYLTKHVAVSNYIEEFFLMNYKPQKEIVVIPNGVQAEVFEAEPRGEMKKIVFLGRLSEEKRPLDYVKIAEMFLKKVSTGLVFDIYGEGPEEKKIKDYIQKNNLKEKISLKGFAKEPEKILKEADVLVLSSVNESFALVVTEAMLSGVIILSTPVGIAKEIITDGKTGFLYSVGDITEATEKLKKLFELSQGERLEISKTAKKIVYEKGLDSAKMGKDFAELINKV